MNFSLFARNEAVRRTGGIRDSATHSRFPSRPVQMRLQNAFCGIAASCGNPAFHGFLALAPCGGVDPPNLQLNLNY